MMILKRIGPMLPLTLLLNSSSVWAADLYYECKLSVSELAESGSENLVFEDRKSKIIHHQEVAIVYLSAGHFEAKIRTERGRYQSRIKDTETGTTVESHGANVLYTEDGRRTLKVKTSCIFEM